MKTFIAFLSLLFVAQNYGFAQESPIVHKNKIGLGWLYKHDTDSKLDIRYERLLHDNHIVGLSLHSNFKNTNGFKVGYKYVFLHRSASKLLVGLDFHYEKYSSSLLPNTSFTSMNMEIPLEYRYKFVQSTEVYLGIAAGFTLNNTVGENTFINNVRAGILRSF